MRPNLFIFLACLDRLATLKKGEKVMDTLWRILVVYLNGFGKGFDIVCMIFMIKYWVDPSLPKIKKSALKKPCFGQPFLLSSI